MLLSIDVGIRNLAMCLLSNDKAIVHWDVDGIPPESSDGLYVSLRKHLDDRPWVLDARVILIEKQPDRNKKMKCVENFLQAYFVIKNPLADTIIYDARHKIPDVAGAGKALYRKRKQTSIDRCKEFIETAEQNHHWIPIFQSSKKKDDLADTVMQGLSYLNRRPVPEVTIAPKAITARRPTENQKETQYSKPNLLWLYRQGLWEKDKRFMKDLKRYWKDINEFRKETGSV
jgi:hypothetical protein